MMEDAGFGSQLEDVKRVVADPLRFKARLEIGEGAFTTLTLRNRVMEFWDVAGMAVTGAQVAKSAAVASTFFAGTSSGFLGLFGAATAVTPIGWVVAASVATGGAYYGVMKVMKGFGDDRVDVIPKFINTPLDILAVGLFDLIAPLALKVAAADGEVVQEELEVISSYFVDDWGYDEAFITPAMAQISAKSNELSLEQLTEGLREFTKNSKDCNHKKVREKVIALLREIAEADGEIHEMEALVIQHVAKCLPKDPWLKIPLLKRKRA